MNWFRAAVFFLWAAGGFAASAPWQDTLGQRLPLYGHRNWIVVADSAYPAQSAPGVETIYADADEPQVLMYVMHALDTSQHVRPIVFMDKELQFLPEADAPGIESYRESLKLALGNRPTSTLAHEKLIAKLAEVSKTFNVLIIKTKAVLPYTTVFLQLDCAYWSPDAESRLRGVMAANR